MTSDWILSQRSVLSIAKSKLLRDLDFNGFEKLKSELLLEKIKSLSDRWSSVACPRLKNPSNTSSLDFLSSEFVSPLTACVFPMEDEEQVFLLLFLYILFTRW